MTYPSTLKTALMTGASSGIGQAIAELLLSEGWTITNLGRSEPAITHANFIHLEVDLTDQAQISALAPDLPKVDALIHSAGLLRVGAHDQLDIADSALMWQLHVTSAATLVQHLAPKMPDGGRIVLIGSRISTGAKQKSLYAATKAGLVGYARSIAAELAPRQITVNVIAPAATDTPMLRDPDRAGLLPEVPPMGRYVAPEEIAATASFLLSKGAASLTGQQIVVCGGNSL